jgi:hypothetical protein
MAINSTLNINGVAVDRDLADVVLESLTLGNPEGYDQLSFTHRGSTSQTYLARSLVTLTIDDGLGGGPVIRFKGRITSCNDTLDGNGVSWHYTAEGGAWLADLVSISHPQRGVGLSPVYNAPPDDGDYDGGLVGLTVGQIVEELLTIDQIATDLWNAGVEAYTAAPLDSGAGYDTIGGDPPVLKPATLADFALMTTPPFEAVRFSGQRLWSQLLDFVRSYAPTFRLRLLPSGTIRCTDTRTLPNRTLTVGTDAIRPPALNRDGGDCATAIRVRGSDLTEGMWFSHLKEDLEEDWTPEEEANWTIDDFARPDLGYSEVDITAMGTATVTVSVTNGLDEWDENYWPGVLAHITLIEDAASGSIQYQITRRIVANTALTVGGTSVLTLDIDLPPLPGFNRAIIVGVAGGSHVHRRYRFSTTRQEAARRIVRRFPFPVSTGSLGTGNQGAITTSVPFGWNVRGASDWYTGQAFALQFDIYTDPSDGLVKIIAAEPTCRPWTQQSDLEIGGDAVTKPDDVRVFVPVSKGALEVRVPPADAVPAYEGRAYSTHGLEYTQTIDLDGWLYVGDEGQATAFAQDLLDSLKDPVVTGNLEILGFDRDAVNAGGIESITLAAVPEFDALDADIAGIPLPVHSVELRWNTAPGNAMTFTTTLNVSNRTFPYHGERNEPRSNVETNSLIGIADFAREYGFFTGEGGTNYGGGF